MSTVNVQASTSARDSVTYALVGKGAQREQHEKDGTTRAAAVSSSLASSEEFIARAEQTDTARALRHFPFACAAETVARRSLRAAKNGIGVVTPDAVSLLHRIAAKCLPQGLLTHLVGLWHRL